MAVVEVRPGNPRYPYKPPVPLTVIVNPVIEPLDDELEQINEGCLSVPNLRGEVPRHVNMRVRYLDRDGVEHDEVRRGLTAGTFQHELDHLDGVLFVDRVDGPVDPHHVGAVRALPQGRVRGARPRARRAGRLVTTYWCELAWLGGERAEAGVSRGGRGRPDRRRRDRRGRRRPGRAARSTGSRSPASPTRTRTRSSARCAAARSAAAGSFWTWREQMYRLAERIDPDSYLALARATYAEMALAGVTTVGEFHYLHHAPGGAPLRRSRTRWGASLIAAAAEAGIRITLLDACYLHGGIGAPAEGAQRRFSDGSAEAWAERVDELAEDGRRARRRSDPQHAGGRSRLGGGRGRAGRASAAGRCTRTCPSSRPRTRRAWRRTARTPDGAAGRCGRARRALHRGARHAPRRTPTSRCSAVRARAAASARRPSATSPTASARCGRSWTRARRSRSAATRTR